MGFGGGFLPAATFEETNDGGEVREVEAGGGDPADEGGRIGEGTIVGKGYMPFMAKIVSQGDEGNLGIGEGHLTAEGAHPGLHGRVRWAAQIGRASSRTSSSWLSLRLSPSLTARAMAALAAFRRMVGLGSLRESEITLTLRSMRP